MCIFYRFNVFNPSGLPTLFRLVPSTLYNKDSTILAGSAVSTSTSSECQVLTIRTGSFGKSMIATSSGTRSTRISSHIALQSRKPHAKPCGYPAVATCFLGPSSAQYMRVLEQTSYCRYQRCVENYQKFPFPTSSPLYPVGKQYRVTLIFLVTYCILVIVPISDLCAGQGIYPSGITRRHLGIDCLHCLLLIFLGNAIRAQNLVANSPTFFFNSSIVIGYIACSLYCVTLWFLKFSCRRRRVIIIFQRRLGTDAGNIYILSHFIAILKIIP